MKVLSCTKALIVGLFLTFSAYSYSLPYSSVAECAGDSCNMVIVTYYDSNGNVVATEVYYMGMKINATVVDEEF